jgi:membrane protease YdiL (CAAX protease family)
MLLRGVVIWLAVAALFSALELSGRVEGLAFAVPLLVALVLARALEATPRAARWYRPLAAASVGACALTGTLAWALGVEGLGFSGAEWVWVPLLAALFGGVLMVDAVRALLLRAGGLDPGRPVHVVAAVAAVLTLVSSALVSGELAAEPATIPYGWTDSVVAVLSDTTLALAGVGFLLTRDLRASLERLGLRRLGARPAGAAVVAALGLHLVVGTLEWTGSLVLPGPSAIDDQVDYEFVGVPPALGAALVSLAAGVGEELVFRGALQPRLGVVLSAALFAALHVQYRWPGMVLIFVVGLGLGLLRRLSSTTFTVVVHVVYDLGAFLEDLLR